MDEVAVLTETLNATLQRHGRLAQNYEIEIANLTVELIKLRQQVEEIEKLAEGLQTEVKPAKS
jgi:hypothetical protein